MKHLPSALLLAAFTSCATPRAHEVSTLPMGHLGRPIGSFLRIEGVRAETGKVGDHNLLVDHVDGAALAQPIELWVENLAFERGERCAISGYETGRWIGLPHEVASAEHLPLTQAGWQFQRYFLVTSVQAPASLASRFGTR